MGSMKKKLKGPRLKKTQFSRSLAAHVELHLRQVTVLDETMISSVPILRMLV
jgi:hypothetical protein